MSHPKRYMRDGTATTRRAHDVVKVECNNAAHAECYEAVTSWAGQPIPRRDNNWHIYVSNSGAVCLLGPLVGRESPQFQEGLKRRVIRKRKGVAE
ncbi:hypothetical protein [Streptomyces sp. NPDC056192]|uniref:hypothetical protein n=1 Tax=Streptomyces sp. NPDC056192 TaxID=3345743 RepID=UPI0035DF8DCE